MPVVTSQFWSGTSHLHGHGSQWHRHALSFEVLELKDQSLKGMMNLEIWVHPPPRCPSGWTIYALFYEGANTNLHGLRC